MTKKHPASSRVHRTDDAPDDAFVAAVKGIIAWSRENRRAVTIGAVVALLIAAGAVWFITQQRSLEAAAAARLTQVQQSVASGNAQLAIRDLQSFLNTFGSTDAADQARLYLADLLIADGRPEEAIQGLGNLPNRLNEPFGLPAARLRAAALEGLQRYDQAIAAYTAIADNARFTYQRREALTDAARIALNHGDPAAAVPLLQRAVDTFADGEAGRGYYEMWLAEARAQARAGQATAPVAADTATG